MTQEKTAGSKKTARRSNRGRPKGSKTEKKPESVGELTRCRACNSTDRERYTNTRTIKSSGEDQNGNPYNRVTWRNTRCKTCKRARVDKFFELVPDEV